MQRRTFIKTAGAAVAAISFPGILQAQQAKKKLPSFGIITGNTGGAWVKENPREALREIARLGYRDLEFGGDFGMGIPELKKLLKELKLNPLIGPTSMQAMDNAEQLKKDIENCKSLGMKYIVCYWPWTDDGKNKKSDDWKQVAEKLNKGGEICRKSGLPLLYHNHDIEFKPVGGQMPFDILMAHLDKKNVSIELDLYWITKGGQSAVEYIQKYPGRFPVYHVKDMDKTPEKSFACVGAGQIDFPEIFKLNKTAGVKHFIVEHDRPENPKECVTASAQYLSVLRF
ncbi:MAG: TIM barrel protein [Tannerella sp.]|jgi:sugar phosphate isomerase/epimerase|nr:TIM barrel protein [Tannerella sp.]